MRDRRMLSLLRGFDFETGICFAGFDSLLRLQFDRAKIKWFIASAARRIRHFNLLDDTS